MMHNVMLLCYQPLSNLKLLFKRQVVAFNMYLKGSPMVKPCFLKDVQSSVHSLQVYHYIFSTKPKLIT